MDKKITLIAVLAIVLLFSGCVEQGPGPSACGNGTCDAGETVQGCPADCDQPPMPPLPGGDEGGQPPSLPF